MAVIIDLITGETINQSFTSTQQTCSYVSLLQDTTTITPSQYNRGIVEYFIQDSGGNYNKIGRTPKGSSFYYDFCSAGIYTVRQLLTIREIPNCGGTSPIIYQSDVVLNITILEYKPVINLPAIKNCIIKGENTNLNFVLIANSNVCGSLGNRFKIEVLESPAGSTVTGVEVANLNSPYVWTVNFNKTGVYLLNVSARNCCYETKLTLTIYVCEPLQIEADCCNCGIFYLKNFSTQAVTYEINQLYPDPNNFEEMVGSVEGLKEVKVEIKKDGVFEIKYIDLDNIEKSKLWYIFCKIDNCLNTILKNILCTDCSDCPSEPNLKDRERLNKIMLLSQLYYKWITQEMEGRTYYLSPENNLLDYNNRIKELYQIDDVYNKILEICSNCASPDTKDCGCGCS